MCSITERPQKLRLTYHHNVTSNKLLGLREGTREIVRARAIDQLTVEGFLHRSGPLIVILDANDIVLAKIAAGLDFDQLELNLAG